MSNIADLLIKKAAHVSYPHLDVDRDGAGLLRLQLIQGPTRFAMLLRHENHLCGYALVPRRWYEVYPSDSIGGRDITYAGQGTASICWKARNNRGTLVTPVKLTEGDWWVGFDYLHKPPPTEPEAVMALCDFEEAIWNHLNDHITTLG